MPRHPKPPVPKPRRKPGPKPKPPPPPPPPLPPNTAPPTPVPPDPLTPDERRFVDEWLVDRNAVLAYMRISPGMAYTVANNLACRVKKRPHVKAEMLAAVRAQGVRNRVEADRVLRGIVWCATYDLNDVYDRDTGDLLPPHRIPAPTREAMTGIRVRREQVRRRLVGRGDNRVEVTTHTDVIEYKFVDKLGAKKMLAAHLGLNVSIPPLDAVLALLPAADAAAVRAALAGTGAAGR